MSERIDLLKKLVQFDDNYNEVIVELKKLEWDVSSPLISISKKDIIQALNKCVEGKKSLIDLISWANAIEGRDDIEFEENSVQDIIFELANAEINNISNEKDLENILKKL